MAQSSRQAGLIRQTFLLTTIMDHILPFLHLIIITIIRRRDTTTTTTAIALSTSEEEAVIDVQETGEEWRTIAMITMTGDTDGEEAVHRLRRDEEIVVGARMMITTAVADTEAHAGETIRLPAAVAVVQEHVSAEGVGRQGAAAYPGDGREVIPEEGVGVATTAIAGTDVDTVIRDLDQGSHRDALGPETGADEIVAVIEVRRKRPGSPMPWKARRRPLPTA